MNLYPILSPWASPESLPLPLRPFSGITPTHTRECGETRKSFSHTFRENYVWCDFTYINQQSNITFTVYRKLFTTANRRNIAPCCCRSVFTRIFRLIRNLVRVIVNSWDLGTVKKKLNIFITETVEPP
jgi:hypothetical protein